MAFNRLRALAALLLGAAIAGVAVRPNLAFASPPAPAAASQVRVSGCAGLNFHPADSDTWYGYVKDMIYHHVTNQAASQHGSGFFLCDPNLPQSAVVTQVQFTLYDNFNGDEVNDCGLVRTPLAGNVPDTFQFMALLPATGVLNTPGRIRKTDSTISYPTINNGAYAYYLQCRVTAEENTDVYTGIFGADVVYSINVAKG
jgi:hypothetical protein